MFLLLINEQVTNQLVSSNISSTTAKSSSLKDIESLEAELFKLIASNKIVAGKSTNSTSILETQSELLKSTKAFKQALGSIAIDPDQLESIEAKISKYSKERDAATKKAQALTNHSLTLSRLIKVSSTKFDDYVKEHKNEISELLPSNYDHIFNKNELTPPNRKDIIREITEASVKAGQKSHSLLSSIKFWNQAAGHPIEKSEINYNPQGTVEHTPYKPIKGDYNGSGFVDYNDYYGFKTKLYTATLRGNVDTLDFQFKNANKSRPVDMDTNGDGYVNHKDLNPLKGIVQEHQQKYGHKNAKKAMDSYYSFFDNFKNTNSKGVSLNKTTGHNWLRSHIEENRFEYALKEIQHNAVRASKKKGGFGTLAYYFTYLTGIPNVDGNMDAVKKLIFSKDFYYEDGSINHGKLINAWKS